MLIVAFLFLSIPVTANESKEIRKERQEAQKERLLQKKERTDEDRENTRDFNQFIRELNEEYREQEKELDMEFELKEVELKAEHDAKVAEAETGYQKNLTGLFMKPGIKFDEETIKKLQETGKAFADEKFNLEKQSAEKIHKAEIEHQKQKNKLLDERDAKALDEATSIGLTRKYSPVLATVIGDGLTNQEKRWNETEEKEIRKIEEKSWNILSPYRNGKELRNWEIQNLNDDFKLDWAEKAEIQKLDAEQVFYNTLFLQAAQGGKIDQEKIMSELADIDKEKKLINIKFKKIADQNRIKRREAKKDILSK